MTAYAIKHIPSGLFLPSSNRARGFTYDEPASGLPRLFHTKVAAKIALTAWLKGEWSVRYGYDGEIRGLCQTSIPSRCASDMKIVMISLSEI